MYHDITQPQTRRKIQFENKILIRYTDNKNTTNRGATHKHNKNNTTNRGETSHHTTNTTNNTKTKYFHYMNLIRIDMQVKNNIKLSTFKS